MDLYILRHGKAEDAGHGRADADRKLTKKGREEMVAVAQWISLQELSFDLIVASPLVRAQETAAIVAGVLGTEQMATWQALVPGGSPDEVCGEIGKLPEDSTVLLAGHEPLLSTLIGRIIAEDGGAGIVMTKGGLARIRNYSFHQRPSGELHWLLTARQMTGTRH